MVTITILFGGNNFNGRIFDSNVHHQTINEILYYFQKIFQRAEHIGSKIFICGLIVEYKPLQVRFACPTGSHFGRAVSELNIIIYKK